MNEAEIKNLLSTFREWVEAQKPVLNSPSDDNFLLRFLRVNDFELPDAKDHLVRFWKYRTENPHWFTNRDLIEDPLMRQIGESGYCFLLPKKSKCGASIFLMRLGHYNSSLMKFNDVTTYAFSVADIINSQESTQIDGLILILDMSEVNLQHVPQFSVDFSRRYVDCWEKMYPARIIQMHFYNYPNLFDPVYGLFRTLYFQGFDERVLIHINDENKSTKNSLHEHIDPSLLPLEYGGELGSIEEINQNFLIWMKERHQIIKNIENYSVDLSKVQNLLDQIDQESA